MLNINTSENFHYCFTWTDLRVNYDKLKLISDDFISSMGETIPKNVKVGDIFLVTGFTDDHGTIVDQRFTIPRHLLDCFYANI